MKIQPSTDLQPHLPPQEYAVRNLNITPLDEPENLSPEDQRTAKFLLRSAILPDDREISVYVPPQYLAEPYRRFPVLYLHDGQNLFDPRTSYVAGHTWRAHTTADRLVEEGQIEPVILVGIANTGVRRMAEYTPTEDARLGGGEAMDYGRLIVEELKPFIDREFRTQSEASATGVGGSSLGGLVSLYLGLRFSHVFGRIAVVSPSIWWDRRSILTMVTALKKKLPLRIWLDMGTGEGLRHLRDTNLLHRLLVSRGWRDGDDLAYLKVPDGFHSEDAWADRFDKILIFLYPSMSPGRHR